ncbi:MAG: type II toxin-antitoxin system prevent-host-death family antitoxin [Thermoleophilaceae bacterium]
MAGTVSVRELRQNLSVYLRKVEAGETLSVTKRGEEVAVLGPPPGRRTAIDRLVADRGATRPVGDLLDVEPIELPPGSRTASDVLEELRQQRDPTG